MTTFKELSQEDYRIRYFAKSSAATVIYRVPRYHALLGALFNKIMHFIKWKRHAALIVIFHYTEIISLKIKFQGIS